MLSVRRLTQGLSAPEPRYPGAVFLPNSALLRRLERIEELGGDLPLSIGLQEMKAGSEVVAEEGILSDTVLVLPVERADPILGLGSARSGSAAREVARGISPAALAAMPHAPKR